MAIDTKTYITPTLRWGLFKKDYPGAPEPEFGLVDPATAGVPDDFCQDECGNPVTQFVRCIVYYPDGRVAATGFKEVPIQEIVAGKPKNYVRNAESYVKLCTMALGRALKRAGYPDRTTDLRAFLLYERRNAEIEIIRAGGPVAALPAGQEHEDDVDQTVEAAAVAKPDEDHPEHPEVEDAELVAEGDSGPVAASDDGQATPATPEAAQGDVAPPDDDLKYPEQFRAMALQLSEDGQRKLLKWLAEKGITPRVAHDSQTALKRAVAKAAEMLGAEHAASPEPAAVK